MNGNKVINSADKHIRKNLGSCKPQRVEIIGVPITATNMIECRDYILENLESIRGEYVCLTNVHTTVLAHENEDYHSVQSGSLMSLPDGKPLSIIGSRYISTMDRVTGPNIMRELFSITSKSGYKHFFYGNTSENLNALIQELTVDFPNLNIAGFEPSLFRDLTSVEKNELAQRINKSGADFVWVGIGAPRQEILCADLQGKVNALMFGVGGAFNILSKITPEAPLWMQNLSLEWLYRLIQEPKRLFTRYLVTNTKFIFYLFIEKLKK